MSRKIGQLEVSDIGLGCMGFSFLYGLAVERSEAVRTIRRAYDLGYTFFDTAECYRGAYADGSVAVNEEVVGKALRPIRDKVVIATKCGITNLPGQKQIFDSRPEIIRRSVEGSLRRLGVDCIDLYYQHRIDENVSPEVVAETMAELISEGKIRHWGISEVGESYLRRAHAVCPVAAVQNRYSLMARWHEQLFPTLEELGIAFVAFSPLANGVLSTHFDTEHAKGDYRHGMPQFTPEGLAANHALQELLLRLAAEQHATPAQISLAWMLARRPYIIPIPGSRREERLRENFGSVTLRLSPAAVEEIDALLAVTNFLVHGRK